MLERFTLDTFAGRLGETFVLRADPEELRLELVEAEGSGHTTPGGRDAFSIVFRGPVEPLLPQATYPIEHEELGAFDLFLVPIGRDDAGVRYEAVFA